MRGPKNKEQLPISLSCLLGIVLLAGCGMASGSGSQTTAEHSDRRAGYPRAVAWYALPFPSCRYRVGYVGGGTVCKGEPRYPSEGVWGLDYRGKIPRKIFLRWSHGRRYQGGTGSYNPDKGPVVPVPGILRKF